jgi:hypothetical protein
MEPFLYALTAVIAFYAAALIVLVDAFLRYKKHENRHEKIGGCIAFCCSGFNSKHN